MDDAEDGPLNHGHAPFAHLSDEELEQELTLAAQHPQRDVRYQELLSERSRRRAARGA